MPPAPEGTAAPKLPFDVDLQDRDLGGLVDRESVRTLFARLGYPVEHGRPTDPVAEGMPERLAEGIRHIEVLALGDMGLVVYLIELASVTVARINELARHFKARAGDTLAVLTANYERVDFVLFDRQTPTEGAGRKQAQAIPRRLSFSRVDGGSTRAAVVLRAVRRLSWTEADGFGQWEKLRSAFAIAEWSEQWFDNRGLFSDYYLLSRLPELAEWKAGDADRQTPQALRVAMQPARHAFAQQSEARLRAGLLEGLFRQLGYEPQERKRPESQDHGMPDYDLCDPATGAPLAACLTYKWDRFLDGPIGAADDPTATENPGAAVVSILSGDGPKWAIVTNGKHWRLYTAHTHSRATNFLQIDLEEAAADSDPKGLRYFRTLFAAEALRPRPAAEGEPAQCFLDTLLEGSRQYAKQVGDRLKDRVFEDVFPILAEGFIADMRRRGVEPDEATLRQVFDGTLTLLYRVLFLLYAESRDLLPVHQPGGYWEKSLTVLKEEVGDVAGSAESNRESRLAARYDTSSTELYARLRELFRIVDRGDAAVNVPPYNGGLFATEAAELTDGRERRAAEFLAEHALSDLHLARALDRLARDPDDRTHGLVFIDFRSLGVRQLGSIYEGLLEFTVRVAPETMAVCQGKSAKAETVLPLGEARAAKGVTIKRKGRSKESPEVLYQRGDVYLSNSKLERKASGSYYTPEPIVAYIVEHTVGPVLEAKLAALRPDLDRACADWRKRQKAGGGGGDFRSDDSALVSRLFDFRVLDPAMGSGHFLVTAVDFVADRLIDFLNGFPGNPVERLLRQTRAAIAKAAADGSVVVDEAKLTDVNLLKRHVLKRCIFGVDLNPMAVELAKVSLWLHCFTLGAPLSFLGHHLKTGNSLIGEMDPRAGIFDTADKWQDLVVALNSYFQVSASADVTASEVHTSRETFGAAEQVLLPLKQRCNVSTARHFERWEDWQFARAQSPSGREDGEAWWSRAQELAEERSFFHWPLEFPEAWYGPKTAFATQFAPKAEPGFDAVVGNPPWERTKLQEQEFFTGRSRAVVAAPNKAARARAIEDLRVTAPALWREYTGARDEPERFAGYVRSCGRYPLTRATDTNLYQLFAEHFQVASAGNGRFGLLTPSGIATDYGTRRYLGRLVEGRALAQVLDFENRKRVFPDVDSRFKFCILIGCGAAAPTDRIECGFFLQAVRDAHEPGRVVALTSEDLAIFNPNTRTLPVFRSARDAAIMAGVYRRLPVLSLVVDGGDRSTWPVAYGTMFHMANDSGWFRTEAGEGTASQASAPLYEGKMIHQYDHRYASVLGSVSTDSNIGDGEPSTPEQHSDPGFSVNPRYWVPRGEVEARLSDWPHRFVVAFRDIARGTDERTCISALGPRIGYGHTCPLLLTQSGPVACTTIVAWLNSFANDYVARMKLSSTHLTWFCLRQQPVPTREQILAQQPGGDAIGWIAQRVLELSYTAYDLRGFAEDLGYTGEPFPWDEERRLHLRCQLDAIFFHVYGLAEDDIDYILETFWIVREHDEERFGRYRTKDLILAYYRAYAQGDWGAWVEG